MGLRTHLINILKDLAGELRVNWWHWCQIWLWYILIGTFLKFVNFFRLRIHINIEFVLLISLTEISTLAFEAGVLVDI